MTTMFHSLLRLIASSLEVPVVILLILFANVALFSIGWLIVEYFTERRTMTVYVPQMLEALRSGEDVGACIRRSPLLIRQKRLLAELTHHPDFSPGLRRSLADNLLEAEQARYDRVLKFTDLLAKISPMLGLLGTLIPLGPGIIALGQGDVTLLSASLLTAFDTTIAGLVVAAVCLAISAVRRRWYAGYMSDLETLAFCVLELQEKTP